MNRRSEIDSAILLAAGLGTRLLPLTLTTPKPLIQLEGVALIDHQLRYLKKHGIRKVAINLHHLADMIEKHVGDGSKYGLSIFYSREPKILGTGGGIKKASTLLNADNIIVLNSDALTDVNIERLTEKHLLSEASATMALRKLLEGESHTGISIDPDGFITSIGKGAYSFTGLQIVGRELLDALPPAGTESCVIADGYNILLSRREKIASLIHEGYWNDLGTHESLGRARNDIALGKFQLITE